MKLSIFLLLALFLHGCSTMKSRIQEKNVAFSQLAPEEQLKVQSGTIEPGFTEDMVYMAKGSPRETETKRVNGHMISTWVYSKPGIVSGASPYQANGLSAPFGYPQFGPTPSAPAPLFYESPTMRVEFADGKVRRVTGQ